MKIAVLEKVKNLETPLYVYDTQKLRRNLDALVSAFQPLGYHVHYAVKANTNKEIMGIIQSYGLGADCVSGNEVQRAIDCGFAAKDVVFAGVGKSDAEINKALDLDIFCFNCESIAELEVIDGLAHKKNKKARIALRLNPNVNAYTHSYITTGLEENKFGINIWELDKVLGVLKRAKNLELKGLHFHIGSQITELTPFKNLCNRVNEIQEWFFNHQIILEHINVGGGLGIDYHQPDLEIPDYQAYFQVFRSFLTLRPNQSLHFELGRSIVGNMGTLMSRVLYIKKGVKTNFAILDAGMTELIRPALYQAYHKIENWSKWAEPNSEKYDVVGPICESSDSFGKAVDLPTTERGDIIAIRSAGAYAEVMASSYNLRKKADVLLV
ncbi:MAG: diaminopimelate decarboxylase [Flavobacteriales bacterium]|nr:diaminopimelate decarboxylase [Flavobacteriales bacterium]